MDPTIKEKVLSISCYYRILLSTQQRPLDYLLQLHCLGVALILDHFYFFFLFSNFAWMFSCKVRTSLLTQKGTHFEEANIV